MKLTLFAMLLSIVCFTSCRTPQQAAQRYLRKAIEKDPSVVGKYTTDTTLKGIAKGTVPVVTPPASGEFSIDSLQGAFDKLKSTTLPAGQVLLHTDSNITVSVKKAENGKFSLKYDIKPKTIFVPVEVPYEVKVKVPGATIRLEVDRPFYHYRWFYIMLAIILVALFLLLRNTRPVQYVVEKIKGEK